MRIFHLHNYVVAGRTNGCTLKTFRMSLQPSRRKSEERGAAVPFDDSAQEARRSHRRLCEQRHDRKAWKAHVCWARL
jgi:hypothetical protein